MKQVEQFRQGDVLIERVSEIPSNAQRAQSRVVALGEGHHVHEAFGEVEVLEADGELYLQVNGEGVLEHVLPGTRTKADHNPIPLPPGKYKVINQREYDPFEDAARQLLD